MRDPCHGGGTGLLRASLLRAIGKLGARICWVKWALRAVVRVAHDRAEQVGRDRVHLLSRARRRVGLRVHAIGQTKTVENRESQVRGRAGAGMS
jgi:hypothetical protein